MKFLTLSRVALRSFMLQAAYNYKSLQGLGMLYAMFPALKELYGKDEDALTESGRRYSGVFNTHPYMAPAIMGAMIHLEETGRDEDWSGEKIDSMKTSLMSAFAGLGDAFFWNALKPAAAIIGLLGAVSSLWLGPFLYLFFYNLPHLACRFLGFSAGYRLGIQVIFFFDKFQIPRQVYRIRFFICGFLGLFMAVLATVFAPPDWPFSIRIILGLGACPAVCVFAVLMKKGVRAEFIIYVMAAAVFAGYSFL